MGVAPGTKRIDDGRTPYFSARPVVLSLDRILSNVPPLLMNYPLSSQLPFCTILPTPLTSQQSLPTVDTAPGPTYRLYHLIAKPHAHPQGCQRRSSPLQTAFP